MIGSLMIGLLIGISAGTQASMPSGLLTMLMYGDVEPPIVLPLDDKPEPVLMVTSSSAILTAMTQDAEVEDAEPNHASVPHVLHLPRNVLAMNTREPVVSVPQAQDPLRPFVFLHDLDAGDSIVAQAGDGTDVDLTLDAATNLPHIKQGEDERSDDDEETGGVTNVFSSSTYVAPAPQSQIPQVVQGNGSSYQNITVTNIASTIISALQNITTTTTVNLTQTCGDHCVLNADVDADAGSDGAQDIDGSSTATTVINQQGSGQSTTASGSTNAS